MEDIVEVTMVTAMDKSEKVENCHVLQRSCLLATVGIVRNGAYMTKEDLSKLKWILSIAIIAYFLTIGTPIFFMTYPFKTVVFTQPIEIMNPRKPVLQPDGTTKMVPQVPADSVVHMKIFYEKFIKNSGLVIRTLIRRKGKEIHVLDSSTVVTTRGIGKGETDATFTLNPNSFLVGDKNFIVFSIYYTLFGVRQVVVQYETEEFDIVPAPETKSPVIKVPPQDWQNGH